MAKQKIIAYGLIFAALIVFVCAGIGIGNSRAHYQNTANWYTVMPPSAPIGVTGNCMVPGGQTVLLDTMELAEKEVPFTLNATGVITGTLHWEADKAEYLQVQMLSDGQELSAEQSMTLQAGTKTVVMKLIPTEQALQTAHDAMDIRIAVRFTTDSGEISGTFLVTMPENIPVPETTEPEVTEPEVTEPEVTEPEVTEPEVTEPEVTEPEVTEPEVTEPEVTEPETTEPQTTEPQATAPEDEEAAVMTLTEPTETQPTESTETQPTDSTATNPTEPVETEPTDSTTTQPTNPAATEPTDATGTNPTEPVVTEPTETVSPVQIASLPEFSWQHSLPLQITFPENTAQLTVMPVDEQGNTSLFPAFTRYSGDGGENWFLLYYGGKVELTGDGGTAKLLLLDFSVVQTDAKTGLTVQAEAFDAENSLGTGRYTAVPALSFGTQTGMLTDKTELTVDLPLAWKDCELRYQVSMLTADPTTNTRVYVPVELTEETLSAAVQTGDGVYTMTLRIGTGEELPPAGTYRIDFTWLYEGTCFAQTELTFFINYSSDAAL